MVYFKLNSGYIGLISSTMATIGDYVDIVHPGHHYKTYIGAFEYFGKNLIWHSLTEEDCSEPWKIINIALHENHTTILYHIRNRKGENAVVNCSAFIRSNFHKKNRENIKNIIIYQILERSEQNQHNWMEKLWDFYENGKIIENKRKFYNFKK